MDDTTQETLTTSALFLLLDLQRLKTVDGWAGVAGALERDVLHTVRLLRGASLADELQMVAADPAGLRDAVWDLLPPGAEATPRAARVLGDLRLLSGYGFARIAKRLVSVLALTEDGRAFLLDRLGEVRTVVVAMLSPKHGPSEEAVKVAAEPPKTEAPAEASMVAPAVVATETPVREPEEPEAVVGGASAKEVIVPVQEPEAVVGGAPAPEAAVGGESVPVVESATTSEGGEAVPASAAPAETAGEVESTSPSADCAKSAKSAKSAKKTRKKREKKAPKAEA